MRACDHKAVQDLHIFEYVPPDQQKQAFNIPPYYWYTGTSAPGPMTRFRHGPCCRGWTRRWTVARARAPRGSRHALRGRMI